MSKNVVLIAGTVVEQQRANGTWARIPRITALGSMGEQSAPKEKTAIEDTEKKYDSGMRDAPDKNLQGQFIPPQKPGAEFELDRALQQEFITRCRAEEEFRLRVTYPDLERATVSFKSLGYEVNDGSQEDWKIFTVNGKQNSRPVWATAPEMTDVLVSGLSAVAVDATITVVATSVPADAYHPPGVLFEVDDPTVATVSQSGLVTGVSAGTAVITATMHGFTSTLSVEVS